MVRLPTKEGVGMGDTAASLPCASALGLYCFLKEGPWTIPEAHPQDDQKPFLLM